MAARRRPRRWRSPPPAPSIIARNRQIQRFKQRPDFQEYVEKVSAGGIEAAKQLFINDLPLYADLFRWGAERAKEKDDVRGLATYAVAAADRILPRKPDLALVQPQQFVFAISEKRLAELDAPEIKVTTERIPPLELPPGAPPRAEKLAKEREWVTQTELLRDERAREKLGLSRRSRPSG